MKLEARYGLLLSPLDKVVGFRTIVPPIIGTYAPNFPIEQLMFSIIDELMIEYEIGGSE